MFLTPMSPACQEKSWPGYVKCGVLRDIRALILNDAF